MFARAATARHPVNVADDDIHDFFAIVRHARAAATSRSVEGREPTDDAGWRKYVVVVLDGDALATDARRCRPSSERRLGPHPCRRRCPRTRARVAALQPLVPIADALADATTPRRCSRFGVGCLMPGPAESWPHASAPSIQHALSAHVTIRLTRVPILHVRMLSKSEQHVPVLGAVVPHVVLERVVKHDRVPVAAVERGSSPTVNVTPPSELHDRSGANCIIRRRFVTPQCGNMFAPGARRSTVATTGRPAKIWTRPGVERRGEAPAEPARPRSAAAD